MQVLTPHLDEPPARGVGAAAVASAVGVIVSLRATYLKFRADHLCDMTGCTGDAQAGWLACDEALQSPWSTLATIPVSIYAAGLFVVTLAAAIALARRKGILWPAARPLLAAGAALAALASLLLGSHAILHFTHLCPYCLALYAVSGVLAVVAARMSLATRALRRWLAAVRARSQAVLDATLLAVTLGLVVVAAQVAAYRLAARSATCPPALVDDLPPAPTIRHHLGGPTRDIVLLFADPSCANCRREFHLLRQSLQRFLRADPEQRAGHDIWNGVELWVYPMPLEPCDDSPDTSWFVDRAGRPLTSSAARDNNACLAARALECLAQQQPERGLEAFAELYALHDTPAPFFTFDKIHRTLRERVSPGFDHARLRSCMDSPRTAARVADYQRRFIAWCAGRPACSVPTALVVPISHDAPRPDLATATDSVRKLLVQLAAPATP